MFCDIDVETAEKFINESENMKPIGNKFEYVETMKAEDKFKIIDKNIPSKNSDIIVVEACSKFLEIYKNKNITERTFKEYRTIITSQIIPYFKFYKLRDVKVNDINNFRQNMKLNNISFNDKLIEIYEFSTNNFYNEKLKKFPKLKNGRIFRIRTKIVLKLNGIIKSINVM